MKNKIFIIAWVLITILLIVYTIMINEENKRVVGITEVEETTVSFPFPVEVSNVSVVPDQQIRKGDLLLELRSDELDEESSSLNLKITRLQQELTEFRGMYQSKLEKVNREKKLEINRLEGDLLSLKIEIENDRAVSGSLNLKMADSIMNPKTIKYQNLEKEIQLTASYYNQLLNLEQFQFEMDQTRLSRELENVQEQYNYVLQKQKELRVLALYDGYIKKVRVEKHTLLESFTPLVTYSKLTPAYVRAFTDENTRLIVNLGSTVSVRSATRKWITTEGVIIAGSKRITELPERLKIQPFAQEWGQEFLIKLPEENEFLIDEKVLIR